MAKANEIKRQLKVGDKVRFPLNVGMITITDFTCEIAEILHQEPWEWRNAYYIEFRDTHGSYRFWKQNFDGGEAILSEDTSAEVELPTKEEIQQEIEDSIAVWDGFIDDSWDDEEFDEFDEDDWDIE